MKRLIRGSTSYSDLISNIDAIVIVPDARDVHYSELPITAKTSTDEDYSSYSDDELASLSSKELRKITEFNTLARIHELILKGDLDYKLSAKQREVLREGYKDFEIPVTDNDIDHILTLISDCKILAGPDIRINQPEKNFALMHGYDMVATDYLDILKEVKADEFVRELRGNSDRYFGNKLLEFIHDGSGHKLRYGDQVINGDMLIYIKIATDYAESKIIAIVSFHDPDGIV